MRSDRLLISLGLFVLTIALFVPVVLIGKAGMTDAKDQPTCAAKNTSPGAVGNTCYVWDNNTCMKGKIKQKNGTLLCDHKASIPGIILLILAGISLISCLTFLGMGIFGKNKSRKGKK